MTFGGSPWLWWRPSHNRSSVSFDQATTSIIPQTRAANANGMVTVVRGGRGGVGVFEVELVGRQIPTTKGASSSIIDHNGHDDDASNTTSVGSFNHRRVTSMMVSGHLHDYYNGPLSSLILTCVSLLQLIVLLFIINDSISILHVHATAPFAWTYVKGSTPIDDNRVKAVGALGVEVNPSLPISPLLSSYLRRLICG
jgi:hypothetical protein